MKAASQSLVAAQRDLLQRAEELDTLTLAEKKRRDAGLQRRDETIRQNDDKLLREGGN